MNFNKQELKAYKLAHKLLKTDFIRFCVVGSVGFTVNLICLTILHGLLKMHITPAQLISAEIALLSNFTLHNIWTFKDHNHHHSFWNRLVRFHMSTWAGVLITVVIVSIGVEKFSLNYLVSLVIASAVALFWNFLWTKFFIFKSSSVPASTVAAESVLHTRED